MEPIRRSTMLLVLALGAAAPFAQEAPDEAGDPPAPAEAPEPAAEDDAGPAGAGGRDVPARPDDDVFVPTEELDADEEVTFPVDI